MSTHKTCIDYRTQLDHYLSNGGMPEELTQSLKNISNSTAILIFKQPWYDEDREFAAELNFEKNFVSLLSQSRFNFRLSHFSLVYCLQLPQSSQTILQSIAVSCLFLTHLHLHDNHIQNHSAQILFEAQFKFIKSLDLSMNSLTQEGINWISKSKWIYLTELNLSNNQFKNKGLKYILKNASWIKLLSLKISNVGLTTDGAKMLNRGCWKEMTELVAGYWYSDSQFLKIMNKCSFFNLEKCSGSMDWRNDENYLGFLAKSSAIRNMIQVIEELSKWGRKFSSQSLVESLSSKIGYEIRE